MPDLVDDRATDLIGDLFLGTADRADRQAVDDAPVGQDPGALGGPHSERHALVQPERAAQTRAVLDGNRDVAHHLAELLRQSVERSDYHLLEPLRLDQDHASIVAAGEGCNRRARDGVITVTRLTEPTHS